MYYKQFEILPSTQLYLKENIDSLLRHDQEILISTKQQTGGVGRQGNSWIQLDNAIALSFTLCPNNSIPLTSLELAVIISKFVKEKFNVETKLKWPNDLFTIGVKKYGGIICNYHSKEIIVVGVGINLTPQLEHRCNDIEPGFILSSFSEIDNEKINELPKELYSFVLKNRMSESKIKEEWEKQCLHLNSNVTILGTDKNVISTGIFQGVGPIGEALIKNSSGGIEKIVSGSLIFK